MVLGKHSGGHGLQNRLSQLGINLSATEISILLDKVRSSAQENKRSLADSELLSLAYQDFPSLRLVNG
jgi:homocitrate synthase NifV